MIKKQINQNDPFNLELLNSIGNDYVFNDSPINRLKNKNINFSKKNENKANNLMELKKKIDSIEDCKLKSNSKHIIFGDGGSAGDPLGHSQNLSTLLGSLIRIDIDDPSGNLNYGIPSDNPFTAQLAARDEIYAYGLRNMWRFSWDLETGFLWGADVGQYEYEEINLIESGGSQRYRELLKPFNLNPSKSSFWIKGISVIENFIDELEEL